MIGLVLLRKDVKESLDDFFGIPKYYPGAKMKEKKAE